MTRARCHQRKFGKIDSFKKFNLISKLFQQTNKKFIADKYSEFNGSKTPTMGESHSFEDGADWPFVSDVVKNKISRLFFYLFIINL
jgi:hypothetical protein